MTAKIAPDQETRRADIRAAALRLMAEVGFEAATPSVIAAAIGRPTHRVLYYYGSREKILDECANLHMDTLLTRTAADGVAALSGAERLHALAGAYAAVIAEDTMSHRALAYYVPCLSPGHQASVRTRMRWLSHAFVLALIEAAPGLPAERAKPLALSLLAMLNAQAVWFREGGGMRREDCAAMAARMVLAEAGIVLEGRPASGSTAGRRRRVLNRTASLVMSEATDDGTTSVSVVAEHEARVAVALELQRVMDLLGGARVLRHRLTDPFDTHEMLLQGLPSEALRHLVDAVAFLRKRDSLEKALGMSLRTFQRRKDSPARPLNPEQSGRTWKFAEIMSKATAVFGSQDEAEQWMERPAIGLDQRRPIDLLATPAGVEAVETYLKRIEYGVYT